MYRFRKIDPMDEPFLFTNILPAVKLELGHIWIASHIDYAIIAFYCFPKKKILLMRFNLSSSARNVTKLRSNYEHVFWIFTEKKTSRSTKTAMPQYQKLAVIRIPMRFASMRFICCIAPVLGIWTDKISSLIYDHMHKYDCCFIYAK